VRPVYVAGTGMTAFGKHAERTLSSLATEAVTAALADAGASASDVEVAFTGNAVAGLVTGQEMVRAHVMLRPAGIEGIPVYAIENACASSSSALNLAVQAIASGTYDIALVAGAEKMSHEDRTRPLRAISTAVDLEAEPEVAAIVAGGPIERSYFMDHYAHEARLYLARTGAEVADFARVAVKTRDFASTNPRAQYRTPITIEDVMGARLVADPLTLLMCSPVGDGAAALVVASAEGLARLRPGAAPVRVLASQLHTGASPGTASATVRASLAAYEQAGLGPESVHVAEVHDAAAPAELSLYEELGFAPEGEGAKLVREGVTARGGSLPVNTSGGLICRGHPVGATGAAQIVELADQLRGRATGRQVPGARIGLAHNAGGWVRGDNAAVAVHILAAED
jgi:acetyl-CoA acetyltransferase